MLTRLGGAHRGLNGVETAHDDPIAKAQIRFIGHPMPAARLLDARQVAQTGIGLILEYSPAGRAWAYRSTPAR